MLAPRSRIATLYYRYLVEREETDSDGDTRWVTVSDKSEAVDFIVQDESGIAQVRASKWYRSVNWPAPEKYQRTQGNYRYTEWRLAPGDKLYIPGKARLDKTTGDSLVFGHEKGSPFIIANVSEQEVMFRKAMKGIGFLAFSVCVLFLGALLVVGGNGQLSSLNFLMASLIAPIFMVFVVFILMYNDLIFLHQRCERNWANIQVSLKKRSNLVPQLESVVKQYLSHEDDLQLALTKLREGRGGLTSSRDVDDYMALEHRSIETISARVEQYPDLEGIELISVFNRRLIKLENEISLIRAGFNDAVTEYRTRCQSFPDNILATLFEFESAELLRFTEKAHPVPSLA